MRLEGKVALISGAANGMGADEARLFASEGARVVIGDILDEQGKQLESEIGETGGQALFVHLDVRDETDWISAVETTVSRFGTLDILINNAGISSRGVDDPASLENWNRIMDINSTGVFLGTKHAVPRMQNNGGGSIVNMSSIMGLVGGESGHPAYNASKGSVRLLTKATAVRYGKDNIRANSVHPGYMPPMISKIPDDEVRRNRQHLIDATPLRREGERMEVAMAVLFLASDDASFITGAELAVDGGFTAA
ncbi:uncharacterized protein METZ01_LOCUS84264 [marine metagenome]|mgnify:FL=1|uniref:Cyclopentanol dehydrogenase n=1 Tax=marine metagenome TaxID=408172 RepID=A0A381UTJ9_9ZZZZ